MTESTPRKWLLLLVILFVASLTPLLFLDLDEASQLASALALPFSVVLAALPLIPPVKRSGKPVPWRRYLLAGAAVVGLLGLGGVGYAVWDNIRDIDVAFPDDGKPDDNDPPWKNGSYVLLPVPGAPPERDRLTLSVSLTNVHETGDCEQTAMLDFVPIIDGREKQAVSGIPGQDVSVPLDGVRRDATVKVVLRYDQGNENCAVRLHIDKAVLND